MPCLVQVLSIEHERREEGGGRAAVRAAADRGPEDDAGRRARRGRRDAGRAHRLTVMAARR